MVRVWPESMIALRRKHANVRSTSRFGYRAVALLTALLLLCPFQKPAAQRLGLAFSPATITGAPGSEVTFSGRITNTTGISLNSGDLFLNFSSYNPTIFTDIMQILGTPNFALPNNTFSAIVPLFRVMIRSTAPDGDYGITATLEDLDNVVSNSARAGVLVVSAVPEPSTFMLLGSGILLVAFVRLKRRGKPEAGKRLSALG